MSWLPFRAAVGLRQFFDVRPPPHSLLLSPSGAAWTDRCAPADVALRLNIAAGGPMTSAQPRLSLRWSFTTIRRLHRAPHHHRDTGVSHLHERPADPAGLCRAAPEAGSGEDRRHRGGDGVDREA